MHITGGIWGARGLHVEMPSPLFGTLKPAKALVLNETAQQDPLDVAEASSKIWFRPSGQIKVQSQLPRPSSYLLLGPKYPLLGTIYPQSGVHGGSW